MALVSGALVKFLATVAALLTVTSGAPRVQCVCPDGRVKFFCPGPSASGCCCTSSAPNPTEAKHRCCSSDGATSTCCAHARPACSALRVGNGPQQAVEPCGCQRSVVTDALAYAVQDVGDDTWGKADGLVAWKLGSDASKPMACPAGIERGSLPPRDLVVILCHFTC